MHEAFATVWSRDGQICIALLLHVERLFLCLNL